MKTHSLYTRLLFTFLSLSLLVATSFSLSFFFLGDRPLKTLIKTNIGLYSSLLVDKIGTPPNLKLAQELADDNGLYINIKSNSLNYETLELPFEFKGAKEINTNASDPNTKFYKKKGIHFISIKRDNFVYLFAFSFKLQRKPPILPIIVGLCFMFFWLFIFYRIVKKLFLPLDHIQNAAISYSKGDFSYHLPEQGNSNLVQLSKSINRMASDIREILDSKRELITAVAHELRTPLTRMKLNVEMIQDEKRRNSISEDVNELSTIVNDILEAESIKNTYTKLDTKSITMNELLDSCIDKYYKKNCLISIESNSIKKMDIDPDKYTLVIKNIIDNAIKYGSEKPIKICITDSFLSISDSGVGVSNQNITKLTQAFYREEKSRNKNSGGIGLGLYLSNKILEAHKHKLIVNSEGKGQGSEFKIEF